MAFDDYITSKDIGSVANALGVANQIDMSADSNRRSEEIHQRRMTALDLVDKERQDKNTALTYVQKGEEIPADANLDPSAIVGAKALHAQGMQADYSASEFETKKKVGQIKGELYGKMAQFEGKRIDFLRQLKPDSPEDAMAIGEVSRELSTNESLQYELVQNLAQNAAIDLANAQSHLDMARKNISYGKPEIAEKSLFAAFNDTPQPLDIEKNGDGTYNLFLNEAGRPKEIQYRNLSFEQALKKGEELTADRGRAIGMLTFAKKNVLEDNADPSKVKPERWINPQTKEIVSVMNYRDTERFGHFKPVFFKNGGGQMPGMTMDKLKENFIPEEDLPTQINRVKLLKAQNEATGNGPKDYKAMNQQLDNYKKSLALVLEPWNKGKEGMDAMLKSFDSGDGAGSTSTGPLKLAMDYYETNRQAFQAGTLKDNELSKFQNAAEAVRLHGYIRNTVNSMHGFINPAAQQSEAPPVQGARKDKNGVWYVQKNGQWRKYNPDKKRGEPTGALGQAGGKTTPVPETQTTDGESANWSERLEPARDVGGALWKAINDNPATRFIDERMGKARPGTNRMLADKNR